MSPHKAGSSTLIFFLCLWTWLFHFQVVRGAEAEASPTELIENGGFVVTSNGSITGELNLHSLFIPASIIKIATSLVALDLLGPSHHYKTEFYLKNRTSLYIKGYGDPFLSSEYIAAIARELNARNIRQVTEIVIDDSSFSVSMPADGSEGSENPYDVPNGAVAVNFNSLSIQVDGDQTVTSGEPQTPLLELTEFLGRQLGPGRHRVNINAFSSNRDINISLRYTGELFAAFLANQGVNVRNNIKSGTVDDNCILIYTFTSPRSVKELVQDCLKFSNNFIANQLFLSCGVALFGYPATWEKGRLALLRVLEERFSISTRDMKIYEGSGLSRRTRVSPFFMLSVLEAFSPYRHLLPQKNKMSIKSGTLTDVFCYGGYFNSRLSSDPFVIMLNQAENNRKLVLKSLFEKHQQTVKSDPSFKIEQPGLRD